MTKRQKVYTADVLAQTSLITSEDPEILRALDFLHRDIELLIAAETEDNDKLESLIRSGCDIHCLDHLGRNALHFAVCTDNLTAIELLIGAGIFVNIKDNLGMTPLSLNLMRRPSLVVVQMLFEHGAKILPRSAPMDTGLFLQFVMMSKPTEEEIEIFKILLKHGALINDPYAPGGRQALHFAAMSNNCILIRLLLGMGADPLSKNHRGQTPKDVAFSFKCYLAYACLDDVD